MAFAKTDKRSEKTKDFNKKQGGFVKLGGRGQAIQIKKGTTVEGYLVSHRIVKSKDKTKRDSILYTLRNPDGSNVEVWGNGAINYQFLEGNGKRLSPLYKGFLVRLVGGGKKKLEKGKNPMQEVEVLVDQSKKIRV